MIDLGGVDFLIDVSGIPRSELEEYSTKLFDEWEAYVGKALSLSDYALALNVEEGSIKGVAKVGAALGVVYMAIGNYGSFISGVQTIYGQINSAAEFLSSRASAPFPSANKPKVKRDGGSLGQLKKLFVKVQLGKITADQAMAEAEKIFGEDARSTPGFMDSLKDSLNDTKPLGQQLPLSLPLVDFEQDAFVVDTPSRRQSAPRLPKPEVPVSHQFRIEIWRESKKEKRKVRVVEL